MMFAPSFEVESLSGVFVCEWCFHGVAAATPDIALSALLILLTTGSALATPCRCAIQLGSLYDSHVVPDASSQTSAFNGKSIPSVCTDCINGVPPRALPKMMSSVGRNSTPALRRACGMIDSVKHVHPVCSNLSFPLVHR